MSTTPSRELISDVLESLPIPEATVDVDHGRQTFLELRGIVQWLTKFEQVDFPPETEVHQQARIAAREESYLYSALEKTLNEPYDDVDNNAKIIQSFRHSLRQYLNDEKIKHLLADTYRTLMFKEGTVSSITDLVTEMGERMEPLLKNRGESTHPAMRGSLDFDDDEKTEKAFEDVRVQISSEGALRTGWQAMNRALGSTGGFLRGEFAIFGALAHQWKSYMMMCIFVHFALFNKPYLMDPTRKPLLYFITFENELNKNLMEIYKYIRENETGEPVIVADIDQKEAAAYIRERLRQNGWHVRIDRFDPTEFNGSDLIHQLEGLQAQGYEICALVLDYLNMVQKSGLGASGVAGDDIRLLFRKVRNFTSAHGITTLTPHQLSSEALQMTRDNSENFVQSVAPKSYYDGCKRLFQEPDLEFAQHIVAENGKYYLTVQRGKHRTSVGLTPTEDRYMVLPFHDVGMIPWDVDKEQEITLRHPGGGVVGSDEETPWWKE